MAADEARGECAACHKIVPAATLRPLANLGAAGERLQADLGRLPADAAICREDRARYRRLYVEELLAAERGEVRQLEREVLASLEAGGLVAEDMGAAFDQRIGFGARAADGVAAFGGSWPFILSFCVAIVAWMALNLAGMAGQFDPYPFILLNLVLSCLAALQAPVIMMSQRRQEARDRLQADNDYKVNLKAELEIRHLHEKIDHQLAQQWERLAEIQRVQLELLEEMAAEARR